MPDSLAGEMNTLSESERTDGWRLLFDGESTAGWRGFRQDAIPDGWQVVEGELTLVAGGGDIISTNQFANFELARRTIESTTAAFGNA